MPIPTLPPTITDPPIPAPPATVKAPDDVDVEAVVEEITTVPPKLDEPLTWNLNVGKDNPTPTFPENSPMLKVPFALARIIGIPEISFTEKIVPEDKLLLIENNCPELPSKDKVLSVNTDNVIGLLSCPINCIDGIVDVPAIPTVDWE